MFQIGYCVELSTKAKVQIDADEVDSVLKAIATGKPVKVRQGIINPSYIVCITADKDRREKFLDDTRHEPGQRSIGMKPLQDILKVAPIERQLRAASDTELQPRYEPAPKH